MSDASPPLDQRTMEEMLADMASTLSELDELKKENSYLRSRIRYLESGQSKCKMSKWSKVKGAFGWEKDDNKDAACTLKVPERAFSDHSSSFSASPAGSCISQSSIATPPPPLSSSSSEDDIRTPGGRCSVICQEEGRRKKTDENRRSKSLDADPTASFKTSIKEIKTPWRKVKGMINTRSVRKRNSTGERWPHHVLPGESGDLEEHSFDEDHRRALNGLAAPKLTVTLPSNEELAANKSSTRQGNLDLLGKLEQSRELSPGISRKSKWFKVRNVFLQGSRSAPSSPIRMSSFTYDTEEDMSSGDALEDKEDDVFLDQDHLRFEIEASYIVLQQKLEEELTKEYCREVNISPEFKKKLDEWDKMKMQGGGTFPKNWENDKERKKKDKNIREVEKDRERSEEEKTKKFHSRANSFRKFQNCQTTRQEVLIPTSTGTFRFEGISDNFTRKLYEWEQARGIAPEESTFALLGPEYQPQYRRNEEQGNGGLTRSKSIGSIADVGLVTVQPPSSLSLNDVNDLSRCGSSTTGVVRNCSNFEPEVHLREPLFCSTFAAEDIGAADSSSSNEDKDKLESMYASRASSSNYHLLQDNTSLLDKIKQQRDACRQLEREMETLEGEIDAVSQSVAANHIPCNEVHLTEGVNNYEYDVTPCYSNEEDLESDILHHYRSASGLTRHGIQLRDFNSDRTTVFDDEATQTSYEDEDVRRYSFYNGFSSKFEDRSELSTKIVELQNLVLQLESTIDTYNLHGKNNLYYSEEKLSCDCCTNGQFSTYALPTQWLGNQRSNDLYQLAIVLREKILDLKDAFHSLSSSRGCIISPPPMSRSLQRSTAHEDLSPGDMNLDFQTPSRTSSSASSFSYQAPQGTSISGLHMDWHSQQQQELTSTRLISGELRDSILRMSSTNVFVPTTRKIFAPVGDAEAVSLIIDEEEDMTYENNGIVNEDEISDEGTATLDSHSSIEQNDDPSTIIIEENERQDGNHDFKSRAKSSSPALVKKTPEFSSVNFYFPTSENGQLNFDDNFPEAEELRLGDELTSSLKMRALKIKKAREEFLMGCDLRRGSLSVIVNDDIIDKHSFNGLKVKFSSEEILIPFDNCRTSSNVVSRSALKENSLPLNFLKLGRRKSKEIDGLAVSSVGTTGTTTSDDSSTKSCPPSPGFEKKSDSGSSSWMKNPAKIIFRPKGKYKISNRS